MEDEKMKRIEKRSYEVFVRSEEYGESSLECETLMWAIATIQTFVKDTLRTRDGITREIGIRITPYEEFYQKGTPVNNYKHGFNWESEDVEILDEFYKKGGQDK